MTWQGLRRDLINVIMTLLDMFYILPHSIEMQETEKDYWIRLRIETLKMEKKHFISSKVKFL